MQKLPSFLKISSQPGIAHQNMGGINANPYQPLLALWLIDMAVIGNWVNKPPSGSYVTTFFDCDFLKVTGLKGIKKFLPDFFKKEDKLLDEEDELVGFEVDDLDQSKASSKTKRLKRGQLKQILVKALFRRREELLVRSVDENLPLFQNISRTGRLLHLNDAEQAVLLFAACMTCFTVFRRAIIQNNVRVNNGQFAQLLSGLSGQPLADVRQAINRHSVLMSAGIIKMENDEEDLEDKIRLTRALQDVILDQVSCDDDLCSQVIHQTAPGKLSLDAFPHLARDIDLILAYLKHVVREGVTGSNILLYGPPGCGKTELAKALMKALDITLYEIAYADSEGDPIDGEQRLQNYNFCQHALKGKTQVALMFDEMEDVLSGGGDDLSGIFGSSKWRGSTKGGKAWVNRVLEQNQIPTIWITNDANIDEAYLRRFDYSVPLRVPPRQVRATITASYLAEYSPGPDTLSALADLDDLLPSQLERAARLAKLSSDGHPEHAWQRVEQSLLRSRELLGQPRVSLQPTLQTGYSLDFIRADANISDILNGLKTTPQATFCLYGPPGTGKSLLARHVADQLGMPLLLKRASDLLDKYVGETEQRIAAMFEQAQDEGAVLVLDEADSFLCDRMGAQRQWEVTQTNEFLTRLESFQGIFFATTNLIDKLDAATLRRFSHKIKFDYLTKEQRWKLFAQELQRLGVSHEDEHGIEKAIQKLDLLTPGDFAAALKNLKLSRLVPTAAQFVRLLEAEMKIKRHGRGGMGFV